MFLHYLLPRGLPVVHDEQDERLKPSNTYLIPLQPLRGGKVAEVNHRANSYILINFGLQVNYNFYYIETFS